MSRRCQVPITKCFFPLPTTNIPPRALRHYARASQIISSIRSNRSNIASCITYKNEVLVTTFPFYLSYAILHLVLSHTKKNEEMEYAVEEFDVCMHVIIINIPF